MNIMRKIFLTFLLVAFASAAFAEGTPKKPSVAGFVSNGFWDNWEVSAGFGTGAAFSNGGNSGSWGDRFGFEGNLSVTKWLHPVFGMRAQLQGGWFNNFDSQIGKMTWPYMFGHVDFMVNASNWIGGYRADRAWYAVPFAGFGYMASNFTDRSQRENASGSRQDFAFTAGLLSKFRLSPAFDFNIELKGLLTKSGICPAEMNGSYLAGLSATAGITYRFNQRGWERGVPGYTADDIRAFQNAVAAGNSALEAARSENADLANRLKAAEAEADAAKAAAAAAASSSKIQSNSIGLTELNFSRLHSLLQLISGRDIQAYILRSKGIGLALLTSYSNILRSNFLVIKDIGNMQSSISHLLRIQLLNLKNNITRCTIRYFDAIECIYQYISFWNFQLMNSEDIASA